MANEEERKEQKKQESELRDMVHWAYEDLPPDTLAFIDHLINEELSDLNKINISMCSRKEKHKELERKRLEIKQRFLSTLESNKKESESYGQGTGESSRTL